MARIEDPYHFLDLAFGYYMTGRFALITVFMWGRT
jgi:hypothetical protein